MNDWRYVTKREWTNERGYFVEGVWHISEGCAGNTLELCNESDALLIAAAPDMLEALHVALAGMREVQGIHPAHIQTVIAAIDKATGRHAE